LKRGRRYDSPPEVEDSGEFIDSWWKWWEGLQPAWRVAKGSGLGLSQDAPDATESWKEIRKGGCNGFFMIVLALSWWLTQSGQNFANQTFLKAFDDVNWVLDQIILFAQQNDVDGQSRANKR
jgi:hypothetical protein